MLIQINSGQRISLCLAQQFQGVLNQCISKALSQDLQVEEVTSAEAEVVAAEISEEVAETSEVDAETSEEDGETSEVDGETLEEVVAAALVEVSHPEAEALSEFFLPNLNLN